MAAIVERYDPDQVWYADDVFTISHPWLQAYTAELKARGIHRPFETITRADRLQNEDAVRVLKELGCYRIWIGSESGSQRILDAMQRGVTVEQVRRATALAEAHGIQVGMFLMWGFEGEEIEDIAATVEHVKVTDPDIFFTTVSYPIKGTPYFDERERPSDAARSHGGKRSDRDYVIRGRHGIVTYYRLADQWLRNEVAAHGLQSRTRRSRRCCRARRSRARAAMRSLERGVSTPPRTAAIRRHRSRAAPDHRIPGARNLRPPGTARRTGTNSNGTSRARWPRCRESRVCSRTGCVGSGPIAGRPSSSRSAGCRCTRCTHRCADRTPRCGAARRRASAAVALKGAALRARRVWRRRTAHGRHRSAGAP